MKDYFGNEVNIGDEVVFIEPYYHNFINGIITKINPKSVRVKYFRSCGYETETIRYEFIKSEVHNNA